MEHLEGCKPGWRISGCEACEVSISTHAELLNTLKVLSHGLNDSDRADVLALIAKAEGAPGDKVERPRYCKTHAKYETWTQHKAEGR